MRPPPCGGRSTERSSSSAATSSWGGARGFRRLLPSFVFLVLLPLLGKPEALRAAERAARLLDRG